MVEGMKKGNAGDYISPHRKRMERSRFGKKGSMEEDSLCRGYSHTGRMAAILPETAKRRRARGFAVAIK